MKIKNLKQFVQEERQQLNEFNPLWLIPLLVVPDPTDVLLPMDLDIAYPDWIHDLLKDIPFDPNAGVIGGGMLELPPGGMGMPWPEYEPDRGWWYYEDPETGEWWVSPYEEGPFMPSGAIPPGISEEDFWEWYENYDPEDWDGDGLPNYQDDRPYDPWTDTDGDGLEDSDPNETDPNDPNVPIDGGLNPGDEDGDGIPDYADPDKEIIPDYLFPPVTPLPPGFFNPFPGSVGSPKDNQPPTPRMPQPGL